MPDRDYKAELEMLREARFTLPEISRLCKLRREYVVTEMDQAEANLRRLEFLRWLVTTGKLRD